MRLFFQQVSKPQQAAPALTPELHIWSGYDIFLLNKFYSLQV